MRLYRPHDLTSVIRGTEPWPFSFIIQVSGVYYTFRPRSDLLLLANLLPRLLVQANSTSSGSPRDRHRMLIQGASVVRFTNSFVNAYSANRTFILVAVFIHPDGVIDRFLLFQFPPQLLPLDRKVCTHVLHIQTIKPVC